MRDMTVQIGCRECKRTFPLNVNKKDILAWKGGMHVQNAFPYLTPDQRELFITRLCGNCFDALVGAPD